ncbi:unnamed protein product, partial [Mesorhabditis spiculigera]
MMKSSPVILALLLGAVVAVPSWLNVASVAGVAEDSCEAYRDAAASGKDQKFTDMAARLAKMACEEDGTTKPKYEELNSCLRPKMADTALAASCVPGTAGETDICRKVIAVTKCLLETAASACGTADDLIYVALRDHYASYEAEMPAPIERCREQLFEMHEELHH